MIFKMMQHVADSVTNFVESLAEFALLIFWSLVYIAIVVTVPIWMIPFTVYCKLRDAKKEQAKQGGEVLE